MMIEYWLISLSHKFVDSQQVINFISFGAAISSILLAIVAIIHSFIQSDSSAKTSGMMREQAQELKTSTIELSSTSNSIASQLTAISSITNRLDDLDSTIRESAEKIASVQKSVDGIHRSNQELFSAMEQKKAETSPIVETTGNSITHNEILTIFFKKSSYDLDLLGYTLYKYSISSIPLTKWQFLENHYGMIEKSRKSTLMNIYFSVQRTLLAINAIQYSQGDEILIINESLKKMLPDLAIFVKKSAEEKIIKGVKAIDESFDRAEHASTN